MRTYKAWHNLAVLYQQEGRFAEAESLWQAVVGERPDFVPGWLGLGESCLHQGKSEQVEQAVRQLEPYGRTAAPRLVLAGQ